MIPSRKFLLLQYVTVYVIVAAVGITDLAVRCLQSLQYRLLPQLQTLLHGVTNGEKTGQK